MLLRTIPFLLIGLLFFLGCDAESIHEPGDDDGARILFILGRMDEAPDTSDAFELRHAAFKGDSLMVSVSYSGGCREHSFSLYSSDVIPAIYPPVISVLIAHDGRGDQCEAYISETFAVDLAPLVESLGNIFSMHLGIIGTETGLQVQYPGE